MELLAILIVSAILSVAWSVMEKTYIRKGYIEGRKSLLKQAISNKNDVIIDYQSEFKTYYVHLKVVDEDDVVVRNSGWGSHIDLKNKDK